MKAHPYADLFPMMSAVELEALTEDIAAHGLRQPVVRYKGLVLDGRNRLLACEKAEVEPAFTDHEGDDESALALVISLNVQRRDMTSAQRAIVAARAWGLDGYSKGGRPAKGKPLKTLAVSLRSLADQFHVSQPTILQARDLLAQAPDLASQVAAGALALSPAHEQLEGRRKEAKKKAADLARIAKYQEAVSAGEMTFADAMQKVVEEERQAAEERAADADAREQWLRRFTSFLEWAEEYVIPPTDEHLLWYTEPDSPGLYDHGITAERVRAAIEGLRRAARLTFGERDGQDQK